MKTYVERNQIILIAAIAVFSVSAIVNWLKADIPYWPLLLHEAGFIWPEVPAIIFYKRALIGLFNTGGCALLLLLNYHLGKKYKLTRISTAKLLALLSISVLLGLLFGHGMKQIEIPQYSILNASILYLIPSELGSKIVWCMLGFVGGNHKSGI